MARCRTGELEVTIAVIGKLKGKTWSWDTSSSNSEGNHMVNV